MVFCLRQHPFGDVTPVALQDSSKFSKLLKLFQKRSNQPFRQRVDMPAAFIVVARVSDGVQTCYYFLSVLFSKRPHISLRNPTKKQENPS